jgi:hypothetical protein
MNFEVLIWTTSEFVNRIFQKVPEASVMINPKFQIINPDSQAFPAISV